MKRTKHLLTILLAMLLLAALAVFASANDVTILDSGYCGGEGDGTNLSWILDDEGTLIISGTGNMKGYLYRESSNASPWNGSLNVKKVLIENGVTSIGGYAFQSCTRLETVMIPNTVTRIGNNSFENCRGLKSISVPDSVTWIGSNAFENCFSLMSVTLSNSLEYVFSKSFNYCTSLTSIIIPSSVKSVGDWAFNGSGLTNVIIPNGVTSIGQYAFYNVELTSATIPKSVTSLGENAIMSNKLHLLCYKNSAAQVYAENHNVAYGLLDGTDDENVLSGSVGRLNWSIDRLNCILTIDCVGAMPTFSSSSADKTDAPWNEFKNYVHNAIILDGTSSISNVAFAGCDVLSELTIPDSVASIGDSAFFGCSGLKVVSIPDNVTIINDYVFAGCSSLVSIEIPRSVTRIGNEAFRLCRSLTNVTVSTIVAQIGNRAFDDTATIHCHTGSTAEAYAIEHGMEYELTHFYEGEWNYDWDNLVRWRKCIHCEERETEQLETETGGEVEIVAPADDDTSFEVEPVSTEYVLIKEALGDANVVKAFDISLKNQDGVHVQPSGTVKVKLPGDFKTGNYKVYRVNADGTYTDMNAYLQGSHLVFETDHFSLYVVVRTDAEATSPDEPAEQNTEQQISWVQILLRFLTILFQKFTELVK